MQRACLWKTPSWHLPGGACDGRPLHCLVLLSHVLAVRGASVAKSILISFRDNSEKTIKSYTVPTVAAIVSCMWRVLVSNLTGLSGVSGAECGYCRPASAALWSCYRSLCPPITSYCVLTHDDISPAYAFVTSRE